MTLVCEEELVLVDALTGSGTFIAVLEVQRTCWRRSLERLN